MNMLLAGDHPTLGVLREQFDQSAVGQRKFTGHGFFTDWKVEQAAPRLDQQARIVLADVCGDLPGVPFALGFVLFVDGGWINVLEGFSWAIGSWPAAEPTPELHYIRPRTGGPVGALEVVPGRDLPYALRD